MWRRRVLLLLAALAFALPATGVGLHFLHEGFRREVSWRVTRPWYGWEVNGGRPDERALLLEVLASREHPVYEGLLLRHAEHDPSPAVRIAAQRGLAAHHPSTWPAQASREFEALAGREADQANIWWPEPFGDDVFAPRFDHQRPRATSAEWSKFLTRYPDFMGADDATYELARAHHFEGDDELAARALDSAHRRGDGQVQDRADASLRHYLVEVAKESTLRTLRDDDEARPELRYYAGYASGLRQLWRLELGAALASFEALGAHPSQDPSRFTDAELRRARRELRIGLLRRLVPIEDRLHAARGQRREASIALELAEEILLAEREIGMSLGFFEPWLLVDIQRPHSSEVILRRLLGDRVLSRATQEERARAAYLSAVAMLHDSRLLEVSGAWERLDTRRIAHKRFRAMAEAFPEHDLSRYAQRVVGGRWYDPPIRSGADPS